MKEDLFILALMVITVPLTGELKIHPFHDTFRISFATPIFLFFLLWMKKLPLFIPGLVVGFFVVAFRVALDFLIKGSFQLGPDFIFHFSAFFYYAAYSIIFCLVKANRLHQRPLLLGSIFVLIDIAASIIELFFRYYFLGNKFSVSTLGLIVIIAIIRSFFVLSFFNIIKLNEVRMTVKQHQEQNEHMLLLISSLYAESIQIKKSLKDAEDITRNCYDMYQDLQNPNYSLNPKDLAPKLLSIAGQVHEIKKDNQRLQAGLSKMISAENSTDYMDINKIGNIIIQTNEKYARSLGKDIKFILDINDYFPHLHIYTILSLINNLTSNSVESINDTGIIKISIHKKEELIEFEISDNGVGIPEKKRNLIFKPGYTTKYDVNGKPSTGMGLSYVKELINNLKGSITLENDCIENKTAFIIQLPIDNLIEKGW
ncbi:sensor histidine kinase [Clostridium sp. P21]|uniref:histidine kinase n=1 Tax=Clostridium muellerianum TaxID=2716538 RepID=A0A7Y0HQL1_9CLOT|nr:sensor histidine kinase [Clostridium muellerianum]NMM64862.1 sensor histidine kinase [Clostridium muellerianum]